INAVYFKGNWTERFDPALTRDATFLAPDGVRLPVKMMSRSGSMRYHQDALAEIADLPYGWDRYAMAVLLPRPGVSLGELREALQPTQWASWLEALQETSMDLQLPRFTLSYETRLVDVLTQLGMGIAFDPNQADFTGINAAGDLHISDVRHKTFVKVDEEGTEAAAVTSVEMGTTSMPPVMRVDRPFVFVIHERHTGAILFIGQVTRPED
ncbi:MAG: serpin family protein, partial [Bacteroidetes bacterium]|nr:serpin family protein [Bacteroidota bacterium]